MRTSKKEAERWARVWAVSQLKQYTVDEIVQRLTRFRTFYVAAWEDCLVSGDIVSAGHFYQMIRRITSLFVDLEIEKVHGDAVLSQTIERIPLILAPMENLDFAHLLEDAPGGEA